MTHWSFDAIFYHIYPLGFCGAPQRNDFLFPPVPRLEKVSMWLDHIQRLGANALYLGPLFESTAHGYDTADYFTVDRRLGDNALLAKLSAEIHRRDMRLVLDGVFNHVGRSFWAFRDVQQNGRSSAYCGWFHNLTFDRRSPYNDPFAYEGWNNHYSLVKLNLANPAVKEHLFKAVEMWVHEFQIDGLRLDAADCLSLDFQRELANFCRGLRPDFWLMGEIVHGDYRRWANPQMLDSVTNYECYKGLYSSLVDKNYFEIAYAINRQFGEGGIYRDIPLYNFADNHDVNRVASQLNDPMHLFPLYCLLFTMPGVPSIYYGSEWGIPGKRTRFDDHPLRPALDLAEMWRNGYQRDLPPAITSLAKLRQASPALRRGSYRQLHVAAQQYAFLRQSGDERLVVALNSAEEEVSLELNVPGNQLVDLLNPGEPIPINNGKAKIYPLFSCWARVFSVI